MTDGRATPGLADLHMHSTASDGTLSPAALVDRVAERGLSGFSLTDHDSVEGLADARGAAERHGLRMLAGAELSANEPERSVHLLAYGIDPDSPQLQGFLADYREDRLRRAGEMVDRLHELGVPLELERVLQEAGEGVVTRAHVGRALYAEGLVGQYEEAFWRFLARGKPAFVEKRPTPPAKVFEVVRAAGGVTLLAHPGREHREEQIRRWAAEGLDGVEIRHPENRPSDRRRLDALRRELGLLRSGGSDWHGPEAGRGELGSEEVPMAWMDEIEDRCRERSGARSTGAR